MNEQTVRAIVRDVIARRVGMGEPERPLAAADTSHVSHYRYTLTPSDGPCLIEPGVRCNHCGYCESHGH
jgi:hypothetical protein